MSLRRLDALVSNLPADSALASGQQPGAWPIQAKLLAILVENVDQTNRLLAAAFRDPKKPAPELEPFRIDWPGRREEEAMAKIKPKRPPSTIQEIKRFFGARIKVVNPDES